MKVLTAQTCLGSWLADATGGPLLRVLLEKLGTDETQIASLTRLPLQQLVTMGQGKLPQSLIDDLVRAANDGVIPADDAPDGWRERVTDGRFSEKTVIVTGAASGIGRAVASRIAKEGGQVIAVDLAQDKLDDLQASLMPAKVTTVVGDITNQKDVDAIVAATDGRIDGLANIVGINDDFSPLHETSDAMWERVMGVNVTGAFKLTRAVLPHMIAAQGGSIVNIASEAGIRGSASGNAYTTSKHAIVGLTKNAAFMYGPQGIRVNAVAPGAVATGIPFPSDISEAGSARLTPFRSGIPSIATADQLAASITFLLSDDGVNVNGIVMPSDGGWSAQ